MIFVGAQICSLSGTCLWTVQFLSFRNLSARMYPADAQYPQWLNNLDVKSGFSAKSHIWSEIIKCVRLSLVVIFVLKYSVVSLHHFCLRIAVQTSGGPEISSLDGIQHTVKTCCAAFPNSLLSTVLFSNLTSFISLHISWYCKSTAEVVVNSTILSGKCVLNRATNRWNFWYWSKYQCVSAQLLKTLPLLWRYFVIDPIQDDFQCQAVF